jgi:hypothetical protein
MQKISLQPEGFDTLLNINKRFLLKVRNKKELKIYSKKFGISYILDENDGTKLSLTNLKKLVPYSPFLQKYKITSGSLILKNGTKIQASIDSQYALFVRNNKPYGKYTINGDFSQKNELTINNKIQVDIANDIIIDGHDVGLHLINIEHLLDDMAKNKSSKAAKNIYINLYKGFLHITPQRKILFDTLSIQTIKEETTAQLQYKLGYSGFRLKDRDFYLYGSNFNDTFMDNLFLQSKFKGGALNFNIAGKIDHYKGIFEIKNTTILDYKVLTNILAFINTVPDLVTFSIPKYSTEGMKVYKGYASFEYKNEIFNFDNIYLDSDQIDIYGVGKASYTQNFIDLSLQLKTAIAKDVSKIPLVGYILFDGKTLSTTLKVKGKLKDPKVSTMLAKDIAVAPLNIIKRTLLLPAHLLGLDKD